MCVIRFMFMVYYYIKYLINFCFSPTPFLPMEIFICICVFVYT